MHFSQALTVFLVTLGTPLALAASAPDDVETQNIEARANGNGNSQSTPIELEINIKDKGALAFDADCWAMLCKGKTNVLQHVNENQGDEHRKVGGSGANKNPFKGRANKGLKTPPAGNSWSDNKAYTSPEEFPFASSGQGGRGAYLFPVSGASQNSQGASLRNAYKAHDVKTYISGKSADGTWFKVTGFTGDVGPYCRAFSANPQDKSVCTNKNVEGDWKFDVADYAYEWDGTNFKYVGK